MSEEHTTAAPTILGGTLQSQPHPCPSCGHCPTCGRGGYHFYPTFPVYPYHPWWMGTTVSIGSASGGSFGSVSYEPINAIQQ